MGKWRRRHIPGAEACFCGWFNAWAKAQAYLRSKDKNEARQKRTRQNEAKTKNVAAAKTTAWRFANTA
jgi:hypothetical protein